MKLIICAPDFCAHSGGTIVLHYLCHLLNRLGCESYLVREPGNFEINAFQVLRPLLLLTREYIKNILPIKINPKFNTPVLSQASALRLAAEDQTVVIYGEMVFGNPLSAKNIVRYLLHTPGNRSGLFYYGPNELHIWMGDTSVNFSYPFSQTCQKPAPINYYPLDIFPPHLWKSRVFKRSQSALETHKVIYSIRKRSDRTDIVIKKDWVCIDGLSAKRQALLFAEAHLFVSYDEYSFLSIFASLSGCDSVVLPPPGISIDHWHPNIEDRYGIAYGFDNLDWARDTKHLLYQKIMQIEPQSLNSADYIASQCLEYFCLQ